MNTARAFDAEVVVVGGGPAGASVAWSLAREGADVLILDRATFPREKVCAEYLSPEASRLLEKMGALHLVEAAGAAELSGMMIRSPSGEVFCGEFAARHGFRGFRDRGVALRRTLLDSILLDRAKAMGARMMEGARVTDVSRDENGVVDGVCVISGAGAPRVLRSRLVIGADGLRSVVARRLGLARRARWPRRIALVAHYSGVDGMTALGEMHVFREGYVGLANVGSGVTNVAIVVPVSRAPEITGGKTDFFEEWIERRPHLRDRFARAERITPVRATGPFASAAKLAHAPGAALVGDAADFFDPFTGEGIYAALRGGEMLAPFALEALGANGRGGADKPLREYERARRAEFAGKWKVERLVGTAVAFPALMNRAARVLARRRDLADLFVGVAGDFVPAREVLRPKFLLSLMLPGIR